MVESYQKFQVIMSLVLINIFQRPSWKTSKEMAIAITQHEAVIARMADSHGDEDKGTVYAIG